MSEMSPADIREQIDHPVVDSDGHYWEHWPDLNRYVQDDGVSEGLNALWATGTFDGSPHWAGVAPEQRPRVRPFRQTWWGVPFANTDDLAAAMAPSLMYRRLDELGLDLAVCYPTWGLVVPSQRNDEVRRGLCRAWNRYTADVYDGWTLGGPDSLKEGPGTAIRPMYTTASGIGWCRWPPSPPLLPKKRWTS